DWCRARPCLRVARRRFGLYPELAAELGDPWGYRRLTPYGGYAAEGRYRARGVRAAVAGRRRGDHEPARLTGDDRARRAPRVHDRSDARRSGAWRGAAARYGRRLATQPERRSARRSTRGRRDRRRRRRRDRDGAVVDPGRALAAAAGGARLQGT